MKGKLLKSLVLASLLMQPLSANSLVMNEPLGGEPPKSVHSSIKDYDYQLKYNYAYETAAWAMPAVSIYGFKRATEAVGGEANTILAGVRLQHPMLNFLLQTITLHISLR